MSLEFHIEITDEDLPVFVDALGRAETRAAGKSAEQILLDATKTFNESHAAKMPQFVRSRLATVESLIGMAGDEGRPGRCGKLSTPAAPEVRLSG